MKFPHQESPEDMRSRMGSTESVDSIPAMLANYAPISKNGWLLFEFFNLKACQASLQAPLFHDL